MLSADRVVLSVMGPHANEDESAIFARKISDIAATGQTLWLCQSPPARPDRAQAFFKDSGEILFLAPATTGGARPTTSAEQMTEFSTDKSRWEAIPAMSPVTGRRIASAYAFVLESLVLCEASASVDLWQYAAGIGDDPVRFKLGVSTLLARKCDTSEQEGRLKSRMRRVIAVGRLVEPYAVWVR